MSRERSISFNCDFANKCLLAASKDKKSFHYDQIKCVNITDFIMDAPGYDDRDNAIVEENGIWVHRRYAATNGALLVWMYDKVFLGEGERPVGNGNFGINVYTNKRFPVGKYFKHGTLYFGDDINDRTGAVFNDETKSELVCDVDLNGMHCPNINSIIMKTYSNELKPLEKYIRINANFLNIISKVFDYKDGTYGIPYVINDKNHEDGSSGVIFNSGKYGNTYAAVMPFYCEF